MSKVEKLNITVGNTPEDGILEILERVRPSWAREHIFIKDMPGGNINQMFTCGLREDVEEEDVVVVRVFGAGLEGIADREKEVLGIIIGHHVGIAPPIYCTFNNGIAYQYVKGCKVNFDTQTGDTYTRAVAKAMAQLHLVDYKKVLTELGEGASVVKYKEAFSLSNFLDKLLTDVPESFADAEREKIRTEELMTRDDIEIEVRRLKQAIDSMNFPLEFCHNDPNTGNIVFNETTGRVYFVDWELADLSNIVNDIGCYFFSHTYKIGVKCEPEHAQLYPTKEYQCQWIRWYLEYKADLSGENPADVATELVERLYHGANVAIMRSLLSFSQWCLGQEAKLSEPGNNFAYARMIQRLFWLIKSRLDKGM